MEEDVQKETHNTEALRGEDPLQRLSIKCALLEDENEEETTNYYLNEAKPLEEEDVQNATTNAKAP